MLVHAGAGGVSKLGPVQITAFTAGGATRPRAPGLERHSAIPLESNARCGRAAPWAPWRPASSKVKIQYQKPDGPRPPRLR